MSSEKKRILVVDDDELLREFYTRVLTMQGYESICVANGDEAIRVLESTGDDGFALIIMDLLMPVRTGWELIEYIRQSGRWQNVPVLAITGLGGTPEQFEDIKQKCDAVLLKGDFEITKFIATVVRLAEHGRSASPDADDAARDGAPPR